MNSGEHLHTHAGRDDILSRRADHVSLTAFADRLVWAAVADVVKSWWERAIRKIVGHESYRFMQTEESKRSRRRVIYSGRVQGVGFRQTVVYIARRYPVTGYVKNHSDGTVELVVDAAADSMHRFLNEIAASMGRYIEGSTSEDIASDEQFQGFEIRY